MFLFRSTPNIVFQYCFSKLQESLKLIFDNLFKQHLLLCGLSVCDKSFPQWSNAQLCHTSCPALLFSGLKTCFQALAIWVSDMQILLACIHCHSPEITPLLLIKQSKTKPTTLQLSFILFLHDIYLQVAYLDQLYCDINNYYSWSSFCTTISSTISASDSWAMRGVGGPTTQLLLLEHVSDWFKMHWNSKEKA